MDEISYMREYSKHSETAMLILSKEGREKLEWLTAQIAQQFQNYSTASNSQSGGFLARLAQGASASKVEKLKPKLQAYADVLKADSEALSKVEDMFSNIRKNAVAKCPHCGSGGFLDIETHIENCAQKSTG
ncbi:hypothetical protein ACFL07_00370 [Pseudomonadota bacterium]